MAGRPPKPTNLLEISGAFDKNPARAERRRGEPQPAGKLGAPPARWGVHPLAAKAAELFAAGQSTNDVATALGVDWETARALRDTKLQDDNAELRKLWRELSKMAPWLTSADRWTAETICELKLRERKGTIRPGERSELGKLCGRCGLNPSDRVRVSTAPVQPSAPPASDPRDAYMRRKMQA